MLTRVGVLAGVTVMFLAAGCGSGDDVAVPEAGDGSVEESGDASGDDSAGGWTGMELPQGLPSDIPIPRGSLVQWRDTGNSVQPTAELMWDLEGSSAAEFEAYFTTYADQLRAAGYVDETGLQRQDLTGGDFSTAGQFVGAERTLGVTMTVSAGTAKLYLTVPDVTLTQA
jgi:hypothetical protein